MLRDRITTAITVNGQVRPGGRFMTVRLAMLEPPRRDGQRHY